MAGKEAQLTERQILVRRWADRLRQAESDRVPVRPLSTQNPEFTVEDAYAIQRLNIGRRIEAGERIVGRKIGLTSKAMQEQLGVDQPDVGAITDTMVVPSGSRFDTGQLIAPRVEAEFAFRLNSDVPQSDPTVQELRTAVGEVLVSAEIIDSRIADWEITLVDTVADNASSARIVVGDGLPATDELLDSLPEMTLRLVRDAAEVASGPGSAVLGDPIVALQWLARTLAAQGDGLRAGDVVLAGAVHASVPLTADADWTLDCEGFPSVTFHTT